MHPVFIFVLIGCAVWFFTVAAMAGKGIGARIGFAFLGIVAFVVVAKIVENIMLATDFFHDALRSGPDIGPIVTFIVLPSVVIVFLVGLWLRKLLSKRAPSATRESTTEDGGQGAN